MYCREVWREDRSSAPSSIWSGGGAGSSGEQGVRGRGGEMGREGVGGERGRK